MTMQEPPDDGCEHTYRMERCGDAITHVVIVDYDPVIEGHEPRINGKLWLCSKHREQIDDSDDAVTVKEVANTGTQ